MDSMPAEVLLQIAAKIPFEARPVSAFQLINRRTHNIIQGYQRSLIKETISQQFSWAPRQFPGLFTDPHASPMGRRQLARVLTRVATLTSIKAKCRVIREQGHTHHCAWTTKRSTETYAAGLLILYRVSDGMYIVVLNANGRRLTGTAPHDQQATLIESLPRTSLAVLLFTLMMSVLMLRSVGPRMMLHCPHHHMHAASAHEREQRIRERADIELACEELLLQQGPGFLLGLMDDRADVTR